MEATATVKKTAISLRLTEDAIEDMNVIAQHLADNGNDAALWAGETNKTYAVIYALRQVADEIRKANPGKFTKP
jgi:hypothetical protein